MPFSSVSPFAICSHRTFIEPTTAVSRKRGSTPKNPLRERVRSERGRKNGARPLIGDAATPICRALATVVELALRLMERVVLSPRFAGKGGPLSRRVRPALALETVAFVRCALARYPETYPVQVKSKKITAGEALLACIGIPPLPPVSCSPMFAIVRKIK